MRRLSPALLCAWLLAAASVHALDGSAPMRLAAKIISPGDVRLEWSGGAGAAGGVVEWSTKADGPFVPLAFVLPFVTRFTHYKVAPDTTYYYRVRPYFGPASESVDVTTGLLSASRPPPVPDKTWAQAKTADPGPELAASVRQGAGTLARPTALTARLVRPTAIQFSWKDHALDEEGYLLEIKSAGMPDFCVCALLPARTDGYGYALVPPETKVSFRVRAYYYGACSNLVKVATGSNLPPP